MSELQTNLWMKPTKFETGDKKYWVKVRLKHDKIIGCAYVDMLIGKRGKTEPHIHQGITLDGRILFMKSRGQVHSIRRVVESAQNGLVEDKTLNIDDKVPDNTGISWKVIMDGKTGKLE